MRQTLRLLFVQRVSTESIIDTQGTPGHITINSRVGDEAHPLQKLKDNLGSDKSDKELEHDLKELAALGLIKYNLSQTKTMDGGGAATTEPESKRLKMTLEFTNSGIEAAQREVAHFERKQHRKMMLFLYATVTLATVLQLALALQII
jgi:hypothetical protein